jgi:phage FluMu protein Com
MELEEQEGVDPVIERRCAECGATLTESEIKAALETEAPFLCTVHANEQVPVEDDAGAPG